MFWNYQLAKLWSFLKTFQGDSNTFHHIGKFRQAELVLTQPVFVKKESQKGIKKGMTA